MTAHPGSMRCCPRPGCGAMLHLPQALAAALAELQPAAGGGAAAAAGRAAGGAAERPAVPGPSLPADEEEEAGLDAECSACGGAFCWQCGEDAHEPASCSQVPAAPFFVSGLYLLC